MQLNLEAENKSFDGHYQVHSHWGESTNCKMVFSIFLPPQSEVKKLPVLIWLSGLTCTEENFRIKAGVQRHAARQVLLWFLLTPVREAKMYRMIPITLTDRAQDFI